MTVVRGLEAILECSQPTVRQFKAIGFCETVLDVKFTGTTRQEAYEFLSMYLDKAKETAEWLNDMYGQVLYEEFI
jgi:hypothetical protein